MTLIEWADKTANPLKVKGTQPGAAYPGGNYCEMITSGCALCFAGILNSRANRFGGNGLKYGGTNQAAAPEMELNIDMLKSWSRMRKSNKIFVCSMTDWAGAWVKDWQMFAMLDAMRAAPKQTFMLLTKRPERMSRTVSDWLMTSGLAQVPGNIWLGISAENQAALDDRLPHLISTPVAVRFLSLEPLLGPIHLGWPGMQFIDWVIVGGESGTGARPLDVKWVSGILAQCQAVGVPTFVKQLGGHWAKAAGAQHKKGGLPDEWPEEMRLQMWPGEVWHGHGV